MFLNRQMIENATNFIKSINTKNLASNLVITPELVLNKKRGQ